ncbi:MAG: hypothetical protein V4617_02760 [Gemmatimonadota bacterium]
MKLPYRLCALVLASSGCRSTSAPPVPVAASVVISPEVTQFTDAVDTATLRATVRNEAGDEIHVPVTWGSSDPLAVSISNSGVVRSMGCGGAGITATAGGVTGMASAWMPPRPTYPASESFAPSLGVDIATMTELSADLFVQELTVGTGALVVKGRQATTRWKVWMRDGTPVGGEGVATFQAASDGVIGVLGQGVIGMRVGGRRRIVAASPLSSTLFSPLTRCGATIVAELELIS